MALPMSPRVVYNSITLNFTQTQQVWDQWQRRIGGARILASGIAVGYKIRRDHLCTVRPVFLESEIAAVMAWIEYAIDNPGVAFPWRFNQSDAATEYSVYLESVDEIKPTRVDGFVAAFYIELVLRSATGTRFTTKVGP